MTKVPEIRIRAVNDAPVRPDGDFVLYWMTAFRRLSWNFALDRAVEQARSLGKPLVILEALRVGYRWASDRHHRFVLDGMAEHARALAGSAVLYHPYVEPEPGAGKGLVAALGRRAAVVVTDDWPAFFHPRMIAAAGAALPVRLEAVDANGLLPVAAASDRIFGRAVDFRRFLQRTLPAHLGSFPRERPLAGAPLPRLERLPPHVLRRWPAAPEDLLDGRPGALARLPIDHSVPPVAERGGDAAARRVLARFLDERLARYAEERSQPAAEAASGLSFWLHFGHVSTHQILAALAAREGWTPDRVARSASGAKEGWWGMSAPAEAFLDELVTWRELGLNMTARDPGYDRYESLPAWARATLETHERDLRPHLYDLAGFEAAATHDELWNAAQRQLATAGRIHNYLRMLWGKKVLHWTASPREALAVMIDRYAVDGRDPSSYSGIFWCLGRYDRPWPPERPVFGTVRYMSSESARRKLRLDGYLEEHAPGRQGRLALG